MDYCKHWLPELLHIQCKREGIKINRVYIPHGVPENLGSYQVQNPASFIIGHLFISHKVAWKNLSVCLSSHPWLLSQASCSLKAFIASYLHPFWSDFLEKIHTNILITGCLPGTFSFMRCHYTHQSQCYNGTNNHPNSRGLYSKVKYNSSDSSGELSLPKSRWEIHFWGTHSSITLHTPKNQTPFNIQIHMKEEKYKLSKNMTQH